MKHLLLILLPLILLSEQTIVDYQQTDNNNSKDDSFLLQVEYGKMLYKNPRGISCAKCHGRDGRGGAKIAKYYDENRNPKILKGVNILDYTLDELIASLSNKYRNKKHKRVKHKVMPMYYLTRGEIEAIHSYLQQVKSRKRGN